MSTQCTPPPLEFHTFGRRQVVGRFDAGRLTSDGGTILLREVDRRLELMRRVAGCFTDYRDPDKVEHSVLELVTQRVGGIALNYEDLNDRTACDCHHRTDFPFPTPPNAKTLPSRCVSNHLQGRPPFNKETNRPQPARLIDSIELVSDAG